MPDPSEIRIVEAKYFKASRDIWSEIKKALADGYMEAQQAKDIPLQWSGLGELNSVAELLNKLAESIESNLLKKGRDAAETVHDTLGSIARDYVISEAESEAEASKLRKALEG